jgi:gas vesicle protein
MGSFLLGFVVGATLSATAVLLLTPSSGTDTRQGITARLNGAIEAGRRASTAREQELWSEFRQRLEDDRIAAANQQNQA